MDMAKGELLANALQTNMAPCQYCQYNGENYYQARSHAPNCRWYTVAGQMERAKILMSEMEANPLHMTICSEDEIIARREKIAPTDAVISITSPGNEHPECLLMHENVLFLRFHDINPYTAYEIKRPENLAPYESGLMQDTHANQILLFIEDMIKKKNSVTRLIVHCEAGISRSPGVALALSIIYGFQPSPQALYKTHTAYNEYVLVKILNAWRLREAQRFMKDYWRA